MQEELDREVEDFARRLNSVWPERRHLGQERRIESHMIGGNGSLQRFSGTIAAKVLLMKIVVLSIVLLLVYNCSGLFIAIRAKMLSKSRKKAAKIVQESATGRITAIMGPSGAGKTTFLNAVLGKTSGYKKDGLVLINGKSGSMQSYKKIIGFVPQDDIIHGNLTVEENLWFSACCRLRKGMSKAEHYREQSLAEQSESTDSVHQNVRQSSDLLDRKTPGVLVLYHALCLVFRI